MTARCVVALAIMLVSAAAHADPDPKRKVVVLEYRSGSSALTGVANRMAGMLHKDTSLDVLGPDQTRAAYGEHLDQVIVKCAGETECVARIGQRVGAAEVILVGVSELGDVILTIQRIEVATRNVPARISDSLAVGSTPSDDQISGYLTRLLPATDFLRFGVLDIVANEAGALVTVSGKKEGLTPIKPLKLRAPASYNIKIEKDTFVTFSTKVQLPADGVLKVEAELSHRGASSSWYQKWYVLAGVGVLAAGVAGGAIYYASQQSSDSVPVGGQIH
jgi:hypothetical protein